MLFVNEVESDGCQLLLRDADVVRAYNPSTGLGVSIDGHLRVPPCRLPGFSAVQINALYIVAETPEDVKLIIAATKRARNGRLLDIECQPHRSSQIPPLY